MNCEHIVELLDEHLDAALSPAASRDVQSHLDGCPDCRRRLDELTLLRRLLARLPAPPPRAGVLERMLRTAVEAPARPVPLWRRPVWLRTGLAAAAVLLLAVGFTLGLQVAGHKPAGPQVTLAAKPVLLGPTVQRVALMFRASDSLQDASISVWLPDDVQIAGRPKVRHLSWRTDLKQGANLLEVPLVATGSQSGMLVVRLAQGSLVRTLQVPIAVQRPKDPGAASVVLPDAQTVS